MTQDNFIAATHILRKSKQNGVLILIEGEEIKIQIEKGKFVHPLFIQEIEKYRNEIKILLTAPEFTIKSKEYMALAAVEDVLREYKHVRQAVVIEPESGRTPGQIIGYIVCTDGFNRTDLQLYLQSKLPENMLPQIMIELSSMPVTEGGEIDINLLPNPEELYMHDDNYAAPVSETQKKLASIWMEVLGVNGVGLYDNFFQLGGHSLLELKLLSKIKRDMDINLSLRTLTKFSNLKALSDFLETMTSNNCDQEGMESITF